MILERGALLNNRYKIVEILGQGGMGSVYRAVDENLGMEVAVKDNLFTTEEYARQFRREAVILANLRHPNLPRVTDHFVIEGQGQYLVMDYIDGEDLRQRMDRAGVLSEEEAIIIGAAICDALNYLSSRNPPIVHRDIKPGNVKITPQGQIYLVDFGLAKIVQGSQATTTGARAMTPGYSPPEQYGTARTDHRSDIFSLGATLYASLTSAIPEDALARAMDQAELTSIRKYNPRISRKLASIIEKSLAIRPDDRYQTPEEFKQALLSARSNLRRNTGEYTVPPPPSIPDKPFDPDAVAEPPLSDENHVSQAPDRSPLPLLISTPLDESSANPLVSQPHKRKPLRGCVLFLVLIALLLAGTGGAVYVYDPNLPSQALAWVLPLASPTPEPVITQPPPTATLDPTPTPSPQPSATNIPSYLTSTSGSPTPVPTTPKPTNTPAPTSTPTPEPTMQGGGLGQIAFASDRGTGVVQIYLANADGSDVRQVTDIAGGACQPDWSPDGERLVFISPCDGNQETYKTAALFIINVDGSGLTPLPSNPAGDYDPAWSPDGKKIAFTSLRNSGRPRIYLLDLGDNSVTRLSDEYSLDEQPAWSPDGKKIAFISTRKGAAQVWIMNPDGSNQELFSHSTALVDSYPDWSPDGQMILFTQQNQRGGFPHLVVAPVEDGGKQEYRIGSGPIPMREAKYSPDGLWIAVESWPSGVDHDIFVMAVNGAGSSKITNDPRSDFDPAWRPRSPSTP